MEFFDFLKAIYVFFTAFTHRYEILTDSLKTVESGRVTVPKKVSTTRWSCRSDAVNALVQGYNPIREALAKIARDENEMSKACSEANGLHDRMCKLETGIYAVFWCDILDRVNTTSHMLQDPKLVLNSAVAMLKSLKCVVREKRDAFMFMRGRERRFLGLMIMSRHAIVNEMCATIHWIMDDQKKLLLHSHCLKNFEFIIFFQ